MFREPSTVRTAGRSGRHRSWVLALLCAGALAACQTTTGRAPFDSPGALDATGSFQANRVPVATPGTTIGPQSRGRVLLANETTLPGDNFIERKPVTGFGTGVSRLISSAGPLPPPFEIAFPRDFQTARSDLGTYHFIQSRPEGGVLCVLALRESGFRSEVVVLRNCIKGTLAEALAPITNGQLI